MFSKKDCFSSFSRIKRMVTLTSYIFSLYTACSVINNLKAMEDEKFVTGVVKVQVDQYKHLNQIFSDNSSTGFVSEFHDIKTLQNLLLATREPPNEDKKSYQEAGSSIVFGIYVKKSSNPGKTLREIIKGNCIFTGFDVSVEQVFASGQEIVPNDTTVGEAASTLNILSLEDRLGNFSEGYSYYPDNTYMNNTKLPSPLEDQGLFSFAYTPKVYAFHSLAHTEPKYISSLYKGRISPIKNGNLLYGVTFSTNLIGVSRYDMCPKCTRIIVKFLGDDEVRKRVNKSVGKQDKTNFVYLSNNLFTGSNNIIKQVAKDDFQKKSMQEFIDKVQFTGEKEVSTTNNSKANWFVSYYISEES